MTYISTAECVKRMARPVNVTKEIVLYQTNADGTPEERGISIHITNLQIAFSRHWTQKRTYYRHTLHPQHCTHYFYLRISLPCWQSLGSQGNTWWQWKRCTSHTPPWCWAWQTPAAQWTGQTGKTWSGHPGKQKQRANQQTEPQSDRFMKHIHVLSLILTLRHILFLFYFIRRQRAWEVRCSPDLMMYNTQHLGIFHREQTLWEEEDR